MLPTIPVFYSLYTVLTVTIEMRQAPFFGWIHDLSAGDPTTFVNLFGLIPWNPATTPLIGGFLDGPLHLGVWPLLYGFMMWLSTSMTPQQGTDPTQKLMMQVMPLMFVFIMGRYPCRLADLLDLVAVPLHRPAVFHHAPLQGRQPHRRLHRQDHGQTARLGHGVRILQTTEPSPPLRGRGRGEGGARGAIADVALAPPPFESLPARGREQ